MMEQGCCKVYRALPHPDENNMSPRRRDDWGALGLQAEGIIACVKGRVGNSVR